MRMSAEGFYGGPMDKWQQPAPQPVAPVWRPAYAAPSQQQGLAVASLGLGIFTVTIGWCYVGILTAPVGIILGIIALVQIRNNPERYTGKPLAIAGIVTSSIYAVLVALFVILVILVQVGK